MDTPQLLEGLIVSGFSGLVFGNFATSPIYRLPRKESLFQRDPYCGDCNAKLMPKDLFPVFSWLATKGKCRYCGASVPATYAGIEAIGGLLFVLCFLKAGFGERFLLVSFGMMSMIMIAMMLYLDNFFSGKTVIGAMVIGLLYRTLLQGSIYPGLGGAFFGMVIGGLVWWRSGKNLIRDITAFPSYMCLLMTAGIWLPPPFFAMACVVAAVASMFRQGRPWMVEWTLITYVVLESIALLHGK